CLSKHILLRPGTTLNEIDRSEGTYASRGRALDSVSGTFGGFVRRGARHRRGFPLFLRPARRAHLLPDRLEEHVERRDGENPDERRKDHPAEHRRADVTPRKL